MGEVLNARYRLYHSSMVVSVVHGIKDSAASIEPRGLSGSVTYLSTGPSKERLLHE